MRRVLLFDMKQNLSLIELITFFLFETGSFSNPSCLSLCSSTFKFESLYQQINILAKCAFLKKHFQYKAES